MKKLTPALGLTAAIVAGAIGLALWLGGPRDPLPMASIANPFKHVDYSNLPAPQHFAARDGSLLAFREYTPASAPPKGTVVLVHGSSASSKSMHVMAKAFSQAGYTSYALDIRGHGDSGPKGDIAYVGQLEDDLEDFMRSMSSMSSMKISQPVTLAGFSSGGGFALRFAGSERQKLFANYLLLSPFISQDAPTYRPDSGGWVSVGLPRYLATALLDRAGVRAFNHLPVVKFAINDNAKAVLTASYSFDLMQNFRPRRDWRATIRAAQQPMQVLVGADDEVFKAEQFAAVFNAERKDVPVTVIPGIGHIALTLDGAALQAAVAAVGQLDGARASQ